MNNFFSSIVFTLSFVLSFFKVFSQTVNYYGNIEENIANSIVEYNDNLYLLGATRLSEKMAFDYYVLELYSNGKIKNEITFGGVHRDIGKHIIVKEDGMYILGRTWDGGLPNNDMYFTKLDFEGKQIWKKYFGGTHNDFGHRFIETKDGGFALIGFVRNQRNGNDWGDIYLVKTDSDGNLLWENFFGGGFIDHGFDVIENENNELISVGTLGGFYNPTSIDFLNHDADIIIFKTNSEGNEMWSKTYGGNGHDWAKKIIAAPGGGYFICGSTQSEGEGSFDFFLMKINEDGDQLWFKTYGGSDFDYGEALQLSEDNFLYILGSSASYSDNFKPDHLLIKSDLEGNQIWSNTYGGEGSDYSSSMICTKDSGCIFTGWTDEGEIGKKDIVLYKITKDGIIKIISDIISTDSVTGISIYPNPASHQFSVELFAPREYFVSFRLFDIAGREVKNAEISTNTVSKFQMEAKSGTYLYRVEDNHSVLHSGKIVLSN